MRVLAAFLGVCCAAACGPGAALDGDIAAADAAAPGERYAASLDIAAFAPATPRFPDEGEAIVPCGPGGLSVEGGTLEVRTGLCDPADVVFVLPDAPAGTRLTGLLTHDVLLADGGLGHAALTLDDEVLWQIEVPIPAPAGYLPIDAVLPDGAPAGSLLGLHVHNHGANVWRVHSLELTR